jgi:hypothetical protein
MWRKVRKVFLFVVANVVMIFVHIQAFQSPIPWLAWLTISIHAYLTMWLIVFTLFRNNKQSKNENL